MLLAHQAGMLATETNSWVEKYFVRLLAASTPYRVSCCHSAAGTSAHNGYIAWLHLPWCPTLVLAHTGTADICQVFARPSAFTPAIPWGGVALVSSIPLAAT